MSFHAPYRELVAAAMWSESHKVPQLPGPSKPRYVETDTSPQASPASSLPSADGRYVSHTRCRSVSSTYAESLTYSASTLSSRPSTPSVSGFPCSPRGASFEPWISSPGSRFAGEDHYGGHIFSPTHSRTPSLDSQVHVMMGYTHQSKSPLRPTTRLERSASIDLPLRMKSFAPKEKDPLPEDDEEDDVTTEGTPSSEPSMVDHSETRPSTADSRAYEPFYTKGRRRGTSFLMAPPPRRKGKGAHSQSPTSMRSNLSIDSDTDGSDDTPLSIDSPDPVVRQICCSILMQMHGIDAVEATVPLKVWDAVVRCLDDVSVAVDRDTAGRSLSGSGSYRSATAGRNSATSTPGHGYGSGDSTNRKRNSRQAGYGDGDGPGDGASGDQQGGDDTAHEDTQRKKPRVESEHAAFSCPFRKRNPLRFNIRDHEHCCRKPIIGIPELKRHIRTYHRREAPSLYQCRRCKKGFPSEEALDDHSMLPQDQICKPSSRAQSDDPEDGITEEMEKVLAGRKATSKVQGWDQIWRLIFPDIDVISPAFEPVIEHFEVKRELNVTLAGLRSQLQDALKQCIPDLDDFLLFTLQRSLEAAVEIYTATAVRNCRNRVARQTTRSTSAERRQARQQPGNGARRGSVRNLPTPHQESPHPATVTATFRSIAPKPTRSESRASPPSEMMDQTENSTPAPSEEQSASLPDGLPLRHFASAFANSKSDDPKQRDSGIVMACPVCLDESGTCSCSFDELPIIDVSMFAQADEHGSCETGDLFQGTSGDMITSPLVGAHGDQFSGRAHDATDHAFHDLSHLPFEYTPAYIPYYDDSTSSGP